MNFKDIFYCKGCGKLDIGYWHRALTGCDDKKFQEHIRETKNLPYKDYKKRYKVYFNFKKFRFELLDKKNGKVI